MTTVAQLVVSDDRLARAAWSRLAEPGDAKANELVRSRGPCAALDLVLHGRVADHEKYRIRMPALDPRPSLDLLQRMGGRLVCPDDEEWPSGLGRLDDPPHCLWVRGPVALDDACTRSVSVVGSRVSTAYGQDTAHEIADGCAERGFTIVSGAALGIDRAAHAAALRIDRPTIAVLAGGVDRPYPAANSALIDEIAQSGALMSEVPPGSAHTRSRFIQRNRMIATMTNGTVVVEAAIRSGALNTARTAHRYHLPVGVIPGPVTSLVSAGCHLVLREGWPVLVTRAAEVAELVGRIGFDLAPPLSAERPPASTGEGGSRVPTAADRWAAWPGWGDLEPEEGRVLEALPLTRGSPVTKLAQIAGVDLDGTRSVLGRLALRDLAVRNDAGWRRGALPPGDG